MIHKAWCCLEEVPYCFSRSSIKFQGHMAKKKSSILTQVGRFRTVTPVWIHQWLWNDAQSLKQHRRGALFFSRSSIKFQCHRGQKIADFDPNWAFPDRDSSMNSPMAMKWCTKLEAAQKRCPIVNCDQAALWMVQVRLSVCLFVCLSVTPFWLCSHHRIITKFSGVITNDRRSRS